jgi:hypothetical protein
LALRSALPKVQKRNSFWLQELRMLASSLTIREAEYWQDSLRQSGEP